MSNYFYDGIIPNYVSGTKSIKVDPTPASSTITLTDGTTTNTLTQSDWTGTIKTVNTTANLTHYVNFSDSSATGQGNPQKSASLTYNPSTAVLSSTTFSGALSGTATTANGVLMTDNNVSTLTYIPFVGGAGPSQQMYVDSITGPLTYNAVTSNLTATTFTGALSGTATTASNVLITDNNTSTVTYPVFATLAGASQALFVDSGTTPLSYNTTLGALTTSSFVGELQTSSTTAAINSFTAGVLTLSCGTYSFRNFTWNLTGTANTLTTLSLTGPRTNGLYYVGIYNGGTLSLTIQTGLGVNTKTTFSSAVVINTGVFALMRINIITMNTVPQTVVDVQILT